MTSFIAAIPTIPFWSLQMCSAMSEGDSTPQGIGERVNVEKLMFMFFFCTNVKKVWTTIIKKDDDEVSQYSS